MNNPLIHSLSRGVDKRKIFLDDNDYLRFIHDLFEFNDSDLVNNAIYRFISHEKYLQASLINKIERKPRKLLVDILAFCLMPNHYHLLLKDRVKNGISKFMQKINMGYVRYFNNKYERSGTLFEGRFKSVQLENEPHFIHMPYYIHCNPLDLKYYGWRKREIKNWQDALKFLGSYRWSSHLDYLGEKNFPSVTNRNLLLNFFGGSDGYKKSIEEWLKEISLDEFKKETLE